MILALAEAEKNIRNVMVKTLRNLVLVVTFFSFYQSQAQVTVKIDEKIEEQLRMKNARIDTNKVVGYRIQIAFSSNRSNASSAKSKFNSRFPEYSNRAYTLYQQPYWKVRVGDYKREIDAQKLLSEVRIYFPDAFVVRDYIKRPMLPKNF